MVLSFFDPSIRLGCLKPTTFPVKLNLVCSHIHSLIFLSEICIPIEQRLCTIFFKQSGRSVLNMDLTLSPGYIGLKFCRKLPARFDKSDDHLGKWNNI